MRRTGQLLALVAAMFGAAQLVGVERSNPPVRSDFTAPPEAKRIIRDACYDCHSNQTYWPWYSAVAPLSWLLSHDVREGRRRLNFSEWNDYASDPGTEVQKRREIAQSLGGGNMAPWYYRVLHPEARLTNAQRQVVVRWALSPH